MVFDEEDYYSPSEMLGCINSSSSNSKKGKMMSKKRFSDEQVRSLETIFENETKLDTKKKLQLAKELGLQPRQIAIWFQNKRARYKSKQLEKDFNILRANYNALSSKFDILKKEKHSLLVQVEKLKNLVGKAEAEKQCGNDSEVTNNEESRSEMDKEEIENAKNRDRNERKPVPAFEGSEYGASILSSDEGSCENTNYFGMEEDTDLLTMVQPIIGDSTLTSPQGWDDLHPNGFFDQHVDNNSQWLDFWS